MVQLEEARPITELEDYTILVQHSSQEILGVDEIFRQCVYVRVFGYVWGVGMSSSYPPVIFVITPDHDIEVLGFAPHLCGPVLRIGVDAVDIHLVIRSPEGDDLYYRLSRQDLSFDNPRGEMITQDHREILYGAG